MATAPPLRTLGYWTTSYKRTYRGTLISNIVSPVLFLAALGVGLGSLVTGGIDGVEYAVWLAPGLLAANAMQSASVEASWPVMGGFKWQQHYHAMLATPLSVDDVLAGHLLWMALRILQGAVIFVIVMTLFGAATTWGVLLAIPAAVLTGMAFAAPIAAFAATQENETSFSAIFRLVITPMFLFSGTFFPVSQLPPVLEVVAWLTPLWNGVALCRGLSLGTITAGAAAAHVAYLSAYVVVGALVARHTFTKRLRV